MIYLELRTTPRRLDSHTSAEDAIRVVLGVMVQWNSHIEMGQKMQARLILSIDRSKHSPSQAVEIAQLALKLRDEGLPIIGLDLSGDPHGSVPDYQTAFDLAHHQNLPISLHFAEIPSVSTEEMGQLLNYNPTRLGHVIHVPQEIRRIIIERGIHVELLLTCNILAGMLPDQSTDPGGHHFGWWYSQKGGISIGTDDVGVFGSWVSDEYALVGRYFGLEKRDMIGLVRRGVGGIFDQDQKGRILGLLDDFEKDISSP